MPTKISEPVFQADDVVAMIGDSITWSGQWWGQLRDQLAVRHPELGVTFFNRGVPGDGAGGALRRYAWDISPLKPSLALVMFGMNDIWRDAYVAAPNAETIEGRNGCLQNYLIAMHALIERLQCDGTRVVVVTPSPYDQYTSATTTNFIGADDALAICAGMVRGLALAKGLRVVDLHTPLRQRVAAGEALISTDRVHPNPAGHDAMAAIVLNELLPGTIVAIPPAERAISDSQHAAECDVRLIAMFRCWADGGGFGTDDAAIVRYLDSLDPSRTDDWLRGCITTCRRLLPVAIRS